MRMKSHFFSKMGVVVLRGNCPTNRGSCPIGVIVLGVDVPRGSCPGGNCPWGSCPMGVIVLQGSCPRGSCPQGGCPRGSCPRGSCPRTHSTTCVPNLVKFVTWITEISQFEE